MHTVTHPNRDELRPGRTGRAHGTRSDRFPDVDAAGSLDMTVEDELTTAAATGNTADVKTLLQAGASVNGANRFGRTALQVMMMGSLPVAQVLLKHGADPNVTDRSSGATPLHDAARTGFLDTVRLLVEFGADPQARDNRQCQPVDLARANNDVDMVNFLQSLSNGQ
ncbi:cdkn2b [Pungitius sinensis]